MIKKIEETAIGQEELIIPNSPYEALYFAVMRSAAVDYQKAFKAGDVKKMKGAERYMREMASSGCVDTILKMIHSGVEVAKCKSGGVM